MDELKGQETGHLPIIAERLFMFFEASQVRDLLLELKAKFPDSELPFDAFSPFIYVEITAG